MPATDDGHPLSWVDWARRPVEERRAVVMWDPKVFELPAWACEVGWDGIEFERSCVLNDRLQAELPAGHQLKGRMITAVAENDRSQQTLFVLTVITRPVPLPTVGRPIAVVTLTGEVGHNASSPPCVLYDSLDAWLDSGLGSDG